MGTEKGSAVKVERAFDSTLECVDDAEAMILEAAGRAGFDEDDQHHISMAARECLVNAVVHGNRYSSLKKVHVSIDARRLTGSASSSATRAKDSI